jgi:CheY-like chemotaxis protein
MSSYMTQIPLPAAVDASTMKLELPEEARLKIEGSSSNESTPDAEDLNRRLSESNYSPSSRSSISSPPSQLRPPLYSILVLCSQKYAQEAIISHVRSAVPKSIPSQITSADSLADYKEQINGQSILFSHVIVSINSTLEIIATIEEILSFASPASIVVLSDPIQRTEIMQGAPQYNYDSLHKLQQLQFVYKPVKPAKLSMIFNPDRRPSMEEVAQSSAQQTAQTQRDAFTDMDKDLGNKGLKVLLVEDNPLNRKVMLKFLGKIGLAVDIALDGVECIEKVFSSKPGHYAVVLVSQRYI